MVETMTLDTDVEIEESKEQYEKRVKKANEIVENHSSHKLGIGEIIVKLDKLRNERLWYLGKNYPDMGNRELSKYFNNIQKEIRFALRKPNYVDR